MSLQPIRPLKPDRQGFTLIEILIALAIFAILATLTANMLRQAFLIQKHLVKQSSALHDLQITLARLLRDITPATNRPVRGNDMRMFPAFIGQPHYIEFTRAGAALTTAFRQQQALIRVGYLCRHHQLIRRTYATLDPLSRDAYEDEVILKHLSTCRFAFLSSTLQNLPVWRGSGSNGLPQAVEVSLTHETWGKSISLFPIPEAMYAP